MLKFRLFIESCIMLFGLGVVFSVIRGVLCFNNDDFWFLSIFSYKCSLLFREYIDFYIIFRFYLLNINLFIFFLIIKRFSFSFKYDSARYISQFWLSWSFKAWNPLFQALLAFKVSLRKYLLLRWVFFYTCHNTIFLSQPSIHFILYTWYFSHDVLWDFLL